MNILVISQEYPPYLMGGVATHVQELVKGLVAAGHCVHVFTYSMECTFCIQDYGATIHFFHFPFKNRKDQYDGEMHEVRQLNCMMADYIKSVLNNGHAPDLIHAHEWLTFECAEQLRTHFNIPVVMTIHMVWATLVENIVPHPQSKEVIQLEQSCCQRADKVIAVSQAIKDEVVTHCNVDRGRVDVVFNGFDAALFDPAAITLEAITAENRQLGLGRDRMVLFAGRLSPQKGLSALLRSAMHVLKEREDVRYVIAGRLDRGGYSDLLMTMVQRHPKLKNKVLFLDRVLRTRLAVLYKLATLVVVPSLYEPFGYAAVEPMAAAKPVIATATGGLAEIIEDGRSGLLVPLIKLKTAAGHDVDVQKFAEAQLRLLDDPALAHRLGVEAQARVCSLFTIEQMVEGTLRSYNSLLSSSAYPQFCSIPGNRVRHLETV